MATENKVDKELGETLKKSKMDVKSESFSVWKCLECKDEPEFEHPEMMKHLREVHGIDIKTAKGSRRMLMHLDGRTWFQTNYEITIQGMKFINYCRNRRAKNDMMRFA